VIEVREVLRGWLNCAGLRTLAAQAGVDRKTARDADVLSGVVSGPSVTKMSEPFGGLVISCYDYHVLNGVDVGRDLHRITHRGGRYKPLPEHIARRKGRRQTVIHVRRPRPATPPILTPQQIEHICEACAI